MEKLSVYLKNCYGIKFLKDEFDFSWNEKYKSYNHVAIYASNGTMKSSLAKTFDDISNGEKPEEIIFHRTSKCEIKDEQKNPIDKDQILVIGSYQNNESTSDITNSSTPILVSEELKKKYDSITHEIIEKKKSVMNKLRTLSGVTEVEDKILEDFGYEKHDLNAIFKLLDEESQDAKDYFSNIKYKIIFNEKVQTALEQPIIRQSLEKYIEQYKKLLNESHYFKNEFDLYNANTIKTNLVKNGFFSAEHHVVLTSDKGDKIIHNSDEFEATINEEKNKIDNETKKYWDKIYKILTKTEGSRIFYECLTENHLLRTRIFESDIKKQFWRSYFKLHELSIKEFLTFYNEKKESLEEIVSKANNEQTSWDNVLELFKKRFSVPFEISIKNKPSTILNGDVPVLTYIFKEENEEAKISDIIKKDVLSTGEERAYYLLNVLFKIEDRKKKKKETLLVIDDIADSFDYKNKYAIIQYLKEISQNKLFHLLIMTHNFDFFRIIRRAIGIKYDNCYFVSEKNKSIQLTNAEYIKKDPFSDLRKKLDTPIKLIVAITFLRNIVEYTRVDECKLYNTLSSMLHCKEETSNTTVKTLFEIIREVSPNTELLIQKKMDGSEKILDVIYNEADKLLESCDQNRLEPKIVLAIAIRLKTEYFIKQNLNENKCDTKKNNFTSCLIQHYKKKFQGKGKEKEIEILDQVDLMTPEIIHLNSFMYEPIIDMDDNELKKLYKDVSELGPVTLVPKHKI